jgi:hypothetical protein
VSHWRATHASLPLRRLRRWHTDPDIELLQVHLRHQARRHDSGATRRRPRRRRTRLVGGQLTTWQLGNLPKAPIPLCRWHGQIQDRFSEARHPRHCASRSGRSGQRRIPACRCMSSACAFPSSGTPFPFRIFSLEQAGDGLPASVLPAGCAWGQKGQMRSRRNVSAPGSPFTAASLGARFGSGTSLQQNQRMS